MLNLWADLFIPETGVKIQHRWACRTWQGCPLRHRQAGVACWCCWLWSALGWCHRWTTCNFCRSSWGECTFSLPFSRCSIWCNTMLYGNLYNIMIYVIFVSHNDAYNRYQNIFNIHYIRQSTSIRKVLFQWSHYKWNCSLRSDNFLCLFSRNDGSNKKFSFVYLWNTKSILSRYFRFFINDHDNKQWKL